MQAATEMTPAEWEIMRVIWTKGAIGSGEVIAVMQRKRDWTESTIKTLLRRLVKKEVLVTATEGRKFIYQPLVDENTAMTATSTQLFDHMCAMKKGRVLTELVTKTELTQADIAALQAVLAAKMQTAPTKVACDCLGPDTMDCCAE